MQIVLVHGIWDSGRVFRRMSNHLSECGHTCFAPDLKPSGGKHGLADLAKKLEAYISEQITPESSFALVGFSMGTLISRYYLQQLGGLERVSHFFSLSGPHRGTLTAHLWPGKAARDMRFGSDFLKELNSDITFTEKIPVRTYRTPFDLMVCPASSSKLPGAENQISYAALHYRMLLQERIFEDIARTLASECPDTP